MKKNKIIVSIFALLIFFAIKGCILDDFDTLTQNIPISKEFTVTGSSFPKTETQQYCLSESSVIEDYRSKIESIELVAVTYQTISIDPTDTKGDLKITLAKSDGTELYSFTKTNISPADYISTPLILTFTDTQLQVINAYLGTLKGGSCFKTSITLSNITPTNKTVTLNGKIDVAFKMKANT